MKLSLLMLLLAGAAPALAASAPVAPRSAVSNTEAELRLPLRSHGQGAGAPEVSETTGGLLVEVSGARLEHSGVMAPPVGSRLSVAIGEIVQSSSRAASATPPGAARAPKRASVTLRFRTGARLRPAQITAAVEGGVLRIGLVPEPPAPATAPVSAPAPVAAVVKPAAGAAGGALATAPHLADELWPRVLGAMALLGIAALLALRLRGRRGSEVRPAAIDIVASRALGRNQRLVVVDVNQQRFLLAGSEGGGLRLVSPINETAAAAGRRGDAIGDDALGDVFADMLASVSNAPAAVKAEGPVEASPSPQGAPRHPEVAAPSPLSERPRMGQDPSARGGQASALVNKSATREPRAAESSAPAPSAERRPKLQLVDREARSAAVIERDAPGAAVGARPSWASEPIDGEDEPGQQERAELHTEMMQRSSDVAGLVALRQSRAGGRR